jgi:beta-1,4-mannosyltransferase
VRWCPVLSGNPYQELLANALRSAGVNTVAISRPTLREAMAIRRDSDIIHVHWLEYLVRTDSSRKLSHPITLVKSVHLLLALWLMRLRGVRVVWTVHNLFPHETRYHRLELWLERRVARLARVVIAHSSHAARLVERTYGIRDVRVAYHGHFVDYYAPATRTRREMRASFGIPDDAHTFLAFGHIRPYKQIPELIRALRETGRTDFHLLVVGRCPDPGLRREIEAAAIEDGHVTVHHAFVEDRVVTDIHAAADVAVLNYRDVFSSSALMLALSCGLPVIAPASSTASEVGESPVVQSFAPGDLSGALIRSASVPRPSADTIRSAALRYTWTALAEPILND